MGVTESIASLHILRKKKEYKLENVVKINRDIVDFNRARDFETFEVFLVFRATSEAYQKGARKCKKLSCRDAGKND